jgi:hypothetical protein
MMQQVLDELNGYELDYADSATKLGSGALPHLNTIIRMANPMLASRATYLASYLIHDEQSITVLKNASRSKHPQVRLAAAAAARNLKRTKNGSSDLVFNLVRELLFKLEHDKDADVQNQAIESLKLMHYKE